MKKVLLTIFVFLFSISIVYSVDVTDATIYYSFDNDNISSDNPLDLSGNSNDGTTTGGTATTGETGILEEAFNYTNTNLYTDTGIGADVSNGSISFWINSSTILNSDGLAQTIISQRPIVDSYLTISISDSTGVLIAKIRDSETNYNTYANITLNDSTFNHYVFSWGSNGMELYENGVLVDTNTYTGTFSNTGNLRIGNMQQVADYDYEGIIDEFGFWQRQLNESEVEYLYNYGTGCDPYKISTCTPNLPNFIVTNLSTYYGSNSFSVEVLTNQTSNISYTIYPYNVTPYIDKTFSYYTGDNTFNDNLSRKNLTDVGNVQFGAGTYNNGFAFNGSNTLSNAAPFSFIDVGQDWAISLWAKKDGGGDYNLWSNSQAADNRWGLRWRDDERLSVGYWDGLGWDDYDSEVLNLGEWYHIVTVRESGTWRMYIDGELITDVGTVTSYADSSAIFTLGSADNTRNFIGEVDEVRVFNDSLSTSEVSNLYNLSPYRKVCQNCDNTIAQVQSLNIEQEYNITWYANASSTLYNLTESFILDYSPPVLSVTSPYNSSEYTINFTNIINATDTNLNTCNLTLVNGSSYNCSDSITFSVSGNHYYNVTATDLVNRSTSSLNNLVFINPNQYFRVNHSETGTYLTNFTVKANGNIYNSIGEYVTIPLYSLGLGSKSLIFSKSGFVNSTQSYTFNSTSAFNETISLTPVTLTIKIYDAADTTTQLTFNVTILNASNSTTYLNQINLSKQYNETLTGDLEMIISSNGYEDITFYNTLTPSTSISIIGYMYAVNSSDVVQFNVQNLGNNANLEDVLIEIQDLIGGTYQTISQAETNPSGLAYFYLDISKSYKVIFTKSGFVSATSSTIPTVTVYNVKLQESTAAYTYVDDISYKFTPSETLINDNQTVTFSGFISGTSITSINYNLVLDNGSTIYTASSTNPTGTTFTYNYNLPYGVNISTITANLTYLKDGVSNELIKTYQIFSLNNETFLGQAKELGAEDSAESNLTKWFFIMILTLSIIIFGVFAGVQGVTLLIIPEFAFLSLIGFVDWVTSAVIIFIALVYFIGGRK